MVWHILFLDIVFIVIYNMREGAVFCKPLLATLLRRLLFRISLTFLQERKRDVLSDSVVDQLIVDRREIPNIPSSLHTPTFKFLQLNTGLQASAV